MLSMCNADEMVNVATGGIYAGNGDMCAGIISRLETKIQKCAADPFEIIVHPPLVIRMRHRETAVTTRRQSCKCVGRSQRGSI